jgi:hypothetical protein
MDADRRRKTVIAGTFAIGRKSLSNAQPISHVGSRRTPVIRMTLCSMNVVGPKGIYARALSTALTLVEGTTGASAGTLIEGVGGGLGNLASGGREGKPTGRRSRW